MDYQYAVWAVGNPATSAEELSQVAEAFPQLGPQIVAHSNCFPELEAWLNAFAPVDQVGEPVQVEGVPAGGKSRKGLFIGVGVAAFMLLGGGATAAVLVIGGDEPAVVAEPTPARSAEPEPEPSLETETSSGSMGEPVVPPPAREPDPEPAPPKKFSFANPPVMLTEHLFEGDGGEHNGKFYVASKLDSESGLSIYNVKTGALVLDILEETAQGVPWAWSFSGDENYLVVLRRSEVGRDPEYSLEVVEMYSGRHGMPLDVSERLSSGFHFLLPGVGSSDVVIGYGGEGASLPTVARISLSSNETTYWETRMSLETGYFQAEVDDGTVRITEGNPDGVSVFTFLDLETGDRVGSGSLVADELSNWEFTSFRMRDDDGTCAPIGFDDYNLKGLRKSTGEVTWQISEDAFIGSLVCSDGNILYGAEGFLTSIDSHSGAENWTADFPGFESVVISAADGDVALAFLDDSMVGIDQANGSIRWVGPFMEDHAWPSVHRGEDTLFVGIRSAVWLFGQE